MDFLNKINKLERQARQVNRLIEKGTKLAEKGIKQIQKHKQQQQKPPQQQSLGQAAPFQEDESSPTFAPVSSQAQAETCPVATATVVQGHHHNNNNDNSDYFIPVVQGTVVLLDNDDDDCKPAPIAMTVPPTPPVARGTCSVTDGTTCLSLNSATLKSIDDLPDELKPIEPGKSGAYDADYCKRYMMKLTKALKVPSDEEYKSNGDFCMAMDRVQAGFIKRRDAENYRTKVQREQPNNKEELDKATKAVQDANSAVEEFMTQVRQAAEPVLENNLAYFASPDYDDQALVMLTVLHAMKPPGFKQWCTQGQAQQESLFRLLCNPELIRLFLQHGGAQSGKYGQAMQNYEKLQAMRPTDACVDPVLDRLLLAVALELADAPVPCVTKDPIDPIERYLHYEQAYMNGELDPAFSSFSVWELRMAVNCDASNDELTWGRQCLRNHRPDIVLMDDQHWRYCWIVRTDVSYKAPDWYKPKRSYDQVLAGGGKCGPRAWYGRFACKAFGIPVWGCKQPSHAAMARWTPNGWETCLGAAMKFSNWEDRVGPDFELEAHARVMSPSSEDYYLKVVRLECLAKIKQENGQTIRHEVLTDPKTPWASLSLLQRMRIAKNYTKYSQKHQANERATLYKEMSARKLDTIVESIQVKDGGKTIIPAAATKGPKKNDKKVQEMKSFLGGRQIFVLGDATLEYELPKNVLSLQAQQQFQFSIRLNTVHRNEQPMLLTVSSDQKSDAVCVLKVPVPYTMGLWQQTEPVTIDIPSGCNSIKLSLARQCKQFGVSIKDLTLTPM